LNRVYRSCLSWSVGSLEVTNRSNAGDVFTVFRNSPTSNRNPPFLAGFCTSGRSGYGEFREYQQFRKYGEFWSSGSVLIWAFATS
jgi:hypothetical protein